MLVKFFTLTETTSDEGYRKIIHHRQRFFYLFIALGILSFIFGLYFSSGKTPALSSFFGGFYVGIGAGLVIASILFALKTRRLLKDTAKLHAKRLEEQDERNQLITQKALVTTSFAMFVGLYLALIVSGIFNSILFWSFFGILIIYFFVFALSRFYFSSKL